MKRRSIIVITILFVLLLSGSLLAAPTTADDAEMLVKGWLKADPKPMDTNLGNQVKKVETFTNDSGEPVYYIVYLEPNGFVIVSADDLVEPIIGFTDGNAYDPSVDNPLGALVTNDLNGRITIARSTFDSLSTNLQSSVTKTQKKWNYLIGLTGTSGESFNLMEAHESLSDVRVAALVKSYWSTLESCGSPCYNYYTPNNYSCGPVASRMAQIMKYHRYPVEPNDYDPYESDGRSRYWIYVNGVMESSPRFLRGGDGNGGPYNWELMPNLPGCNIEMERRQAVGSICYDAGISIGTRYYSGGTSVSFWDAKKAFLEIFDYANAVGALNYYSGSLLNIDKDDLMLMVNPNLDAGNPVIFAIMNSNVGDQHAVICDGYGYNASTIYHHVNLGWDFLPMEYRDLWYELPDISDYCEWVDGRYRYWFEYNFNTICGCLYNIFTSETGEIISGRVFDGQGVPVGGVVVTAQDESGVSICTTLSNEKGIYALKGLESETTFIITAEKPGYTFNPVEERTGRSEHGSSVCGNKWEVNFGDNTGTDIVTVGTQSLTWSYPVHTVSHDSRTQVIYLSGEIGRSGYITGLALDIETAPGQSLEDWTIRMKHTSKSVYDDCSMDSGGWTLVYRNNESIVNKGWCKFEFDTPFAYNGADNLLVDFSHNNSSFSEDGLCRVSSPGGMRSVYACSDSEHGDPLMWSTANSPVLYCSNNVPNVRLSLFNKTVDIVEEVKLVAADGKAGDYFGRAVSICGDYAIVGAPGEEATSGSAYIFKREGTIWAQQAKLRISSTYSGNFFGGAVSINSDYAVVGAYGDSTYHGAAYIFKREGTDWIQQVRLAGRSGCVGFGDSVLIDGNYIIIGERGYVAINNGRNRSWNQYGAAYIYNFNGTDWTEQAVLVGSDTGRDDRFGDAVSISGDYVIAASEVNYNPYKQLNGAAYVFKRDGSNWDQQAKVIASDGTIADSFGRSIAISGDYFAVGAPSDDENGNSSGSVYIFKREGNSWTEQTKLWAGEEGDNFGEAISMDGNYIVIGARNDDDNGRNSGSVFVYERKDTNWEYLNKIIAGDGRYDDLFGVSVLINGDYIIVGAEGDDDNGSNSGSAYIFKIE